LALRKGAGEFLCHRGLGKMIHLTKKDFRIEWYSGTGAGGQYRNKHQNCCRIIHIETGLSAVGTAARERKTNQYAAFTQLVKRLIPVLMPKENRDITVDVIRNYNEFRNEVHDKISGLKMPYKMVINGIGPMIEARHNAMVENMTVDI